jgi:hypothetical protein
MWNILLDQTELMKYETISTKYTVCVCRIFPTSYRKTQWNFSMQCYFIKHKLLKIKYVSNSSTNFAEIFNLQKIQRGSIINVDSVVFR